MRLEALSDLRNRIFSSRRFQHWASVTPGVRSIAHRRSAELFDLTAGFVYSQVLYACVELGLFERLGNGAAPMAELAEETELSPDAFGRLAKAAAALQLMEIRSGDRLALGPQGAALLGNPSVFEMIKHHRILFDDLKDPVDMLRAPKGETGLGAYWGYASQDRAETLPAEKISPYSKLMAATQGFIADEVTSAHDFSSYRSIMDVGGGTGAFLTAVARKAPEADLTLFDLPAVTEQATARFRDQGLAARSRVVGGNFLSDELPSGADIITLVRVLHDQDDGDALTLLSAIHRALPNKGSVLIAEPMSGTKGAEAMGDAYFGIYLWAMGRGAPRSPDVIGQMLRQAGFQRVRRVQTRRPLLTRILVGEKTV